MGREIDKRDYSFEAGGLPPQDRGAASAGKTAVSASAPMDFDRFTGSIRRMTVENAGFGVQSSRLLAMELAKQASSEAAAFTQSEPTEFALPQEVRQTSGGGEVVHVQQLLRGIPVFQASRTVHFRPDGAATITGSAVDAMGDAESEPRLDAIGAIQLAARYLADADDGDGDEQAGGFVNARVSIPLELPDDFSPVQTAAFDLPAQPRIFSAAPFEGPLKASLVYFYTGPQMRLAWLVELVFAEASADYAVLVAAGEHEPGEILYAADRVCNLLGVCDVHTHNPRETPQRARANFPLAQGVLPSPLTPGQPARDWIDSHPSTIGNNVVCEGSAGALAGTRVGNVVSFGPFAKPEDDQIAHTFYFCNVMHDFFETLGFDEAAGNFQQVNHTGAPGGGDPVRAFALNASFSGVATMATPPDGQSPVMKMGPWQNSGRHSALDSDVVFHEFVHGVTNRLVGGRLDQSSLSQPQSRGMGEGWSDYFALTFQNVARKVDKTVSGDWLTGQPTGIRGFPYDDNFPDGFGAIGTGRYTGPHAIGELWCAALIKATRDFAVAHGNKRRAYAIVWQSVVDGLKLTPSNPSFLDARDAILAAIDDLQTSGLLQAGEHQAARLAFWTAFAHSGMGPNASSRGASLIGIVADTSIPQGL